MPASPGASARERRARLNAGASTSPPATPSSCAMASQPAQLSGGNSSSSGAAAACAWYASCQARGRGARGRQRQWRGRLHCAAGGGCWRRRCERHASAGCARGLHLHGCCQCTHAPGRPRTGLPSLLPARGERAWAGGGRRAAGGGRGARSQARAVRAPASCCAGRCTAFTGVRRAGRGARPARSAVAAEAARLRRAWAGAGAGAGGGARAGSVRGGDQRCAGGGRALPLRALPPAQSLCKPLQGARPCPLPGPASCWVLAAQRSRIPLPCSRIRASAPAQFVWTPRTPAAAPAQQPLPFPLAFGGAIVSCMGGADVGLCGAGHVRRRALRVGARHCGAVRQRGRAVRWLWDVMTEARRRCGRRYSC